MAISGNQGEKEICVGKERKQKGISQSSNEEKFESSFPYLGFGKAQEHFDWQRLA